MKKIVNKVHLILYNLLGMDRINTSFIKFSVAHLCFMVAANIQGIFVNILLIRNSSDVNISIIFNMIVFGCNGISMFAAAKIIKKFDLRYTASIGIGLHIIGYLCFLFLMEDIASYAYMVAVLFGCGGGVFWITYFNALTSYSTDESRDVSIAYLGMLTGVIALSVPAISGSVISAFEGYTGYMVMFGFAFMFSGVSIFLYTRLQKTAMSNTNTAYIKTIKSFFTSKCWIFAGLQLCNRSIRDGVFLFFLNVLLYEFVPSEAVIGYVAVVNGLCSIFGQLFCGKVLRPSNRLKIMFIAITILIGTGLLLFVQMSALTIIVLSVMNSFFIILVMNPAMATEMRTVQIMPGGRENCNEFFGLFEIVRNTGRLIGLGFLFLVPKTPVGYAFAITILTATLYLALIFSKLTKKALDEYEAKQINEVNNA